MINRSSSFIYSTAPSPLIAATVRAALEDLAAGAMQGADTLARADCAHAGELMRIAPGP